LTARFLNGADIDILFCALRAEIVKVPFFAFRALVSWDLSFL
jgi:hypothetical protein